MEPWDCDSPMGASKVEGEAACKVGIITPNNSTPTADRAGKSRPGAKDDKLVIACKDAKNLMITVPA